MTDAVYYRARYFDPSVGRFISEDPIGFPGSGTNFYAYVHNSPVNLTDALGLCDKGCVEPNFLTRFLISRQAASARALNQTVGLGLGVTIGAGVVVGQQYSYSRQVVISPDGHAAFVTTVSHPSEKHPFNSVMSGGWGGYGGLQVSRSNAHTPQDLNGPAVDAGFGGGDGLGGGVDGSLSGNIWQLTGTAGVGIGGYGKGLAMTNTTVQAICGTF